MHDQNNEEYIRDLKIVLIDNLKDLMNSPGVSIHETPKTMNSKIKK